MLQDSDWHLESWALAQIAEETISAFCCGILFVSYLAECFWVGSISLLTFMNMVILL